MRSRERKHAEAHKGEITKTIATVNYIQVHIILYVKIEYE